MDIVFCGTPAFALPTLQTLVDQRFNVRLVVTQPDRPRGRGLEVSHSPVKQRAQALGLPLAQPEKIKMNQDFRAALENLHPHAIVVVGYGHILPPWMIALPPLGNINLHASLLPKYRGAAPIQWAIANGETITGVTTMRIDAGLDTGDILLQQETRILPTDTAKTLAPRLAELGAGLMCETLRALESGSIQPRPQDHSQATLAPLLKKEDGLIDFQRPATEIWNRLRGFQPWPGAFTTFRGKTLHVINAKPAQSASAQLQPGEIRVEGNRLLVGSGANTLLELLQLQPQGRKAISARDFINGHHPAAGERLGG